MSTSAHEPGRTAYEARFAGFTLGPRGVAEKWEDLLPVHQAIWARVEEAVRAMPPAERGAELAESICLTIAGILDVRVPGRLRVRVEQLLADAIAPAATTNASRCLHRMLTADRRAAGILRQMEAQAALDGEISETARDRFMRAVRVRQARRAQVLGLIRSTATAERGR